MRAAGVLSTCSRSPSPAPAGVGLFRRAQPPPRREVRSRACEFNHRRDLGRLAIAKCTSGEPLTESEDRSLTHIRSEAKRVEQAVHAIERADAPEFARLLLASHRSLQNLLRVSCPEADELVEACLAAGALGARLTGAGFGGFVLGFCRKHQLTAVLDGLERHHYASKPWRDRADPYLLPVTASRGALHER